MRLLACAALAACWTGDPPPETPRPPPAAPRPQARASHPSGEAPAVELAKVLRTDAPTVLPSYVLGPIVYLDLDAQRVSVLCGVAAHQAAINWSVRLIDPALPDPTCSAPSKGHFVCQQVGPAGLLQLDLLDPDQPELASAIVGTRYNGSGLHALLGQMQAQLTNPTCP